MKIILSLIFGLSLSTAYSQFEDLRFYADAMTNAQFPDSRIRASDSFQIQFNRFLERRDAFNVADTELPGVSVLYSPDSSFRIMTYQMHLHDGIYKYGGVIQRRNGQYYALRDKFDKSRDAEYASTSSDDWYGAKYREMLPFELGPDTLFVLFGLDGYSKYNRRAIGEVLKMTPDGPEFGFPVFGTDSTYMERNGKFRLIFEYSLDAQFILTYDPNLDRIVFPHLTQVPGRFKGQGPTYVPEGTFEGYKPVAQGWFYIPLLFQPTNERIDANKPDGQDENLDILGRPKQKSRN